MLRKTIVTPRYDHEEAEQIFLGKRLLYADAAEYEIAFANREDCEFRTPHGKLVALLKVGVFTSSEQQERHRIFNQVKGSLGNRAEIFGKGAYQQLIRKDGELSPRYGVAKEVLKAHPDGGSDMLGPYRYRNSGPGVPHCDLSGWTRKAPDLYKAAYPIVRSVGDWYRALLPNEYATQMKYIHSLLPQWTIPGSPFTTVYGIRNLATAVHRDEFDIPTATGVITTTGDFVGCEMCMPAFGLAFDVRPSDLLFLDVHQLHGNFPQISGTWVCQVYFVRRGMDGCGE
jgi:hypothetical protein